MNYIVYGKSQTDKKYQALSNVMNLPNMSYAPTLMYASIFPGEKIERLKEYLRAIREQVDTESIMLFQIRSAKNKIVFSV